MNKKRIAEVLRADADGAAIVDAIKRKDASYIRGALQWYDRKAKNEKDREFCDFLRKSLSNCRSQASSSSPSSATSSSSRSG